MTEPIPGPWVDAALAAAIAHQRTAREAVWFAPSHGQVRAMLEAVAPLIEAQARIEARLDLTEAAVERAARILADPLVSSYREKLAAIEAHAPSIMDALRHALSYVEHVPNPSSQSAAERYRSALAIIGTEGDGRD